MKILRVSPIFPEATGIPSKVCSLLHNNRSRSMVIKKKKSQIYFGIILNVQKICNDSTKSFCICLPQFSSLGTLVKSKTSTLITVKRIADFLNSTRFSTNVLFLIWDSVPYNSPISGVQFNVF